MIFDLPLHPLAVHLPVVMVPVSFILVTIAVLSARARRHVGVIGVILSVVGAIGAIIAYLSGDPLAEQVGEPLEHARWGVPTIVSSLIFAALAVTWLVVVRRRDAATDPAGIETAVASRPGGAATGLGALAVVAAIAASTFVVLAGHSGAQAAWAGTMTSSDAADDTDAADEAPADAPADEGSTSAPDAELTMAAVEENATPESCWVAIDGTVYDLTDWAPEHPGGAERIEALCGTDATEAFGGQHGGQSAPMEALTRFELGPLAD